MPQLAARVSPPVHTVKNGAVATDHAAAAEEAEPVAGDSVFLFPASSAQRRFWLLDQLRPGGNAALNMPLVLWLQGPLDRAALERAFNEVVRRHESLRTTFHSERGVLQQVVAPTLAIPLPLVDARSFPPDERDRVAPHLIKEEARVAFDLARGPLVRTRLLRVADEQHFLLLTLHHIITDGWSNGIILRELTTLYAAFLAGQPSPLPEPALQFADYSEWQTAALATDENGGNLFDADLAYWREKLAGELPVLDLPTDWPRPGSALERRRVAESGMRTRVLPRALAEQLRALCAREGISPFMVHLAAFETLLHRYTGATDLMFSSPLANRNRPELENVVGLLVNPLILRADLSGNPKAGELLARVRQATLAAFAHGELPFERLVEELRPERLQVSFLYQSAFIPNTALPGGLRISPVPPTAGGALFELSVGVIEEGEGVRLHVDFNQELYAGETIERWLEHYQTLLAGIVADLATPIAALPMLTATERQQFGAEPAGAAAAAALQQPDLPEVRALLAGRVIAAPDAVAVCAGRRELSCAELLARLETAGAAAPMLPRAVADLRRLAAFIARWRDTAETAVEPDAIALTAACLALRDLVALQPGERLLAMSPAGSVAAAEEAGAALLAGALLVYPPPEILTAPPAALLDWLAREKATVACLPAALWHRLHIALTAPRRAPLTLPATLRLVVVCETGGSGEGTFGRTTPSLESMPRVIARQLCPSTVVGIGTVSLAGQPLPGGGQRWRLLERHGEQPAPTGVIGELAVFPTEAGGDASPIRTGELARWRADRALEWLGRSEAQQFSRGFRLDLRRTEETLCAAVPGLRHALVQPWGEPAAEGPPRLVAYVFSTEPLPAESELRRLLRAAKLPDELLPAAFLRLDDLPLRAADGRLDLAALPPPSEAQWRAAQEPPAAPVQPYLPLHHQLLAIWEEVLGVTGLGIQDDFFDLGGNSLLALRMLHRIELACGEVILPATLFTGATVERLAEEITRRAGQETPAVVRINEKGPRSPLFHFHGDLVGGGFYSLRLSRALGPQQPFYALPPQDVSTLPAEPSIEAMAAEHLRAIREIRPHGPYVLGGFCIGGLVAYEAAQQLTASGEEVEMLLLIDSATENRTLRRLRWGAQKVGALRGWDAAGRVTHFGRWEFLRARLQRWARLDFCTQANIALRRLREKFRGQAIPENATPPASADGAAGLSVERDVETPYQWATASYRAQPYAGPMALLLSADLAAGGGQDSSRGWRRLAPAVTVHPLPGSHLECITAHVETLAETLQECLQTAARQRSRPRRQNLRRQPPTPAAAAEADPATTGESFHPAPAAQGSR